MGHFWLVKIQNSFTTTQLCRFSACPARPSLRPTETQRNAKKSILSIVLPDFLSLRHHKNWLLIFNKLFIYFHILMKISQNFSKFWKLQQLELKTWDNFLAKFSVTGIFCHFYVTFEIHVLITQVFISKFLASTLLALDFWTLNWKFKCASGKGKSAETR